MIYNTIQMPTNKMSANSVGTKFCKNLYLKIKKRKLYRQCKNINKKVFKRTARLILFAK